MEKAIGKLKQERVFTVELHWVINVCPPTRKYKHLPGNTN